MSVRDELPVPEKAKRAEGALETVRVWLAQESAHVNLRVGAWDDPTECGALIAELAEQIADAYVAHAGIDRRAVLHRLKEAMIGELESPTVQPSEGDPDEAGGGPGFAQR
jgi:hypothetical protein